ncbi:hypothetical protein ACFWAY_45005 [Rhodococcus sp. NPDC059968]|uniref:hypothetical protein n=1 Tax=Rhodococcus sp. NPDC059968 TaxID=3347017 RepID=UPI00366C7BE9
MIVIGIDPHKSTHTATAVDPVTNTDLGSLRIDATLAAGHAYYDTKIAEGKSPRAATRSLKRHLSDHVWRIMLTDEKRSHRQHEKESDRAA